MKPLPYCLIVLAGCALAQSGAAATNTGYRCTGANGSVSFQDKPCAGGQQSKPFEYDRTAAPPGEGAAPAEPAPIEESPPLQKPAISAVPPPRPPPPILFRCVRADNEKVYYSETGQTQSYQVPAGVVGLPGSRLGDQVRMSAPESNRPAVAAPGGAASIATAFVTVQDRCEQLTPAEACRALRAQLEENLDKQRRADKSERPGLEAEAIALVDKQAGC
ncbi:hypothetical protein DFR29_101528 [Tahibacter aquaticus]|uniref:DUF4124 domain-containing protein n=1 Tax=Tahibacter aquaticus TaxID=520092 RepID=A0A4R6ZAX3_9GAMM|nr:DUF4124 domain-containing protein [Tahibacter aquaticus]TDR48904.1 hypothetical protein DFR29_101528 [Tahibacter aquaticus]